MEFKRESVIALHLAGKQQAAIVRALKHLNVNKSFVSRTIARYRDTGSVARRHGGGCKKTATSPEMVRKVKELIEQNPRLSGRELAQEMNISVERMQYILKNELKLKAHKIQKEHQLTDVQQKKGPDRTKELPNSVP